jgi:hypothetical protein
MRIKLNLIALAAGLVIAGSAAEAQRVQPGKRPAAAGQVEQRKAQRQQLRKRLQNMTPEQKEYAKAMREERKLLAQQVKAGTLDKAGAREAFKAWRKEHQPPKKTP